MKVVHSRADFLAARAGLPDVGLVLTMGALHAGHAALMSAARADGGSVVATVFVNPLQFGPQEDLARYPRSLERDVELAERAEVDLLWAPAVEDVYPAGRPAVGVHPGPLGEELEGAARPGHFAGVLTVVCKFLNIVRPDRAYFGEKDYQQLVLVRRMVADLDLGVEIRAVPTVREDDGLALSSRNVYLGPDERVLAVTLSRALRTGSLDAARAELAAQPGIAVDYLALRAADLGPVTAGRPARLLVAARVGATRLIDNMPVGP